MTRRNSPFSPFSEKFDAEILLSPYIGEEIAESFRGAGNECIFSLVQQTQNKGHSRWPQGP